MITTAYDSLVLALTAFESLRTPSRIVATLRNGGRDALQAEYDELDPGAQGEVEDKAHQLDRAGVGAILYGDPDFPARLIVDQKPLVPAFFYKGNRDLLTADSVGMCGSRNVSAQGLKAATRCGEAVSRRHLTIVSGYAKGVDTATHLAALRTGGSTVIVLAEGIDFFRVKRDFAVDFDPERTLVLSQFAPSQTWAAHAAMARNAIIYGLSKALIVIEAGEKGGTLAAGEGAMKIGRPVLVVDFGDETPAGNRKLLNDGASPVRTPQSLYSTLDAIPGEKPEPKLF